MKDPDQRSFNFFDYIGGFIFQFFVLLCLGIFVSTKYTIAIAGALFWMTIMFLVCVVGSSFYLIQLTCELIKELLGSLGYTFSTILYPSSIISKGDNDD